MKFLSIVAAFVLSLSSLMAQETLNFKWMEGRKEIGTLVITYDGDVTNGSFNYVSTIKMDYAEPFTLSDEITATYKNDTLINTTAVRKYNNSPKVQISEVFEASEQTRTIRNKEDELMRPADVFHYILLFIQPPKEGVKIYSTFYGELLQIRENVKNAFTLQSVKNRRENFIYDEEGTLTKAQIEFSVGTYTLVPVKK